MTIDVCRLPPNDVLKPYAGELLRVCLIVLATDNEDNGLLCLRIAFDLHKAYRPGLTDHVAGFLDFARKAGHPLELQICAASGGLWFLGMSRCLQDDTGLDLAPEPCICGELLSAL